LRGEPLNGFVVAHTFGEGGPDVELIVFGAALLVLGIVFFVQKSAKPVVSLVLVLASFALVAGAFTLDTGDATEASGPGVTSEAEVVIVEPSDGEVVEAGAPLQLEVEVEGGTLVEGVTSDDPTEGHLHIFVDGALVDMPSSASSMIELEPGTHELTVEFTQADHRSFEPRVLATIELVAE
jgi:hypothetical protein